MQMTLDRSDIRGVIPPLVTPFAEDEELDLAAFRREIQSMLDLGVNGFVVGGSTGEGYTLTGEELAELCRVAVEEVSGRVPVIAGVITTSTRDAIRRGKLAREAGVAGVMVTPPIYEFPSGAGMVDFYGAIWRAVGRPILIYNVMAYNPVPPALLEQLVEAVPGIVGIKESAGGSLETLSRIIRRVGDRIAVTWAQDALIFPGYALGAVGSISGINTILPEPSVRLFAAVARSDLATAREIHDGMAAVAEAVGVVNWPAGVKAAINLQGRAVGRARRPFVPIPPEQERQLRDALADAGAMVAAPAGLG